MKILVGQHELKIDKKDKVNQNEYKVTKCEFEFDKIKGMKDVSLVFMPGSYFDLESIEFKK